MGWRTPGWSKTVVCVAWCGADKMMRMITEHPAHFISMGLEFAWHGRVNYRSSSAPGSPPPPTTNATGQQLTTIPPDGHPRNPSSSDVQRAVTRNADPLLGRRWPVHTSRRICGLAYLSASNSLLLVLRTSSRSPWHKGCPKAVPDNVQRSSLTLWPSPSLLSTE